MVIVAIGMIFPVLSTLGPENDHDIRLYEIPRVKWSLINHNLGDLLISGKPAIITEVPTPRSDLISTLLLLDMPQVLTNVKVSQSNTFIYFSSEQSWSKRLNGLKTHSLQNLTYDEFLARRANSQDQLSYYYNRLLRNHDSNIMLQALAPHVKVLSDLPHYTPPESYIWLSSAGVTAATHYDMEHNFFLQVNGTKKFLVTSPIHYNVFQPYSSLHPHWRQSRHPSRYLTVKDIKSACAFEYGQTGVLPKEEYLSTCLNLSSPSENPVLLDSNDSSDQAEQVSNSDENGVAVCGPYDEQYEINLARRETRRVQTREKYRDALSTTREGDGHPSLLSSVHEVHLNAGDMLYLPPLYFHSVTTLDQYSVSINSWIGSKYLSAALKLSTVVPLPYMDQAPMTSKLSSVGAYITLSIRRLQAPYTPLEFMGYMRSRVSPTLPVEGEAEAVWEGGACGAECSTMSPYSSCTDSSIRIAGVISFLSYSTLYC
jgi:hypothetical protein